MSVIREYVLSVFVEILAIIKIESNIKHIKLELLRKSYIDKSLILTLIIYRYRVYINIL